MKRTLVGCFGDFLTADENSSKKFVDSLPSNKQLSKVVLPVGYFRRAFLKPIKKYKPQRVIYFGMHENRAQPMFETVAKNQMVTLKKPLVRFAVNVYSHLLRLKRKNLRIKKQPSKDMLTILPISKSKERAITLHTKPPKISQIPVSKDAGYFVCNYQLWVVETFLRRHARAVEFYFIHVPAKLSASQKQALKEFVFS